MTGVKCLLLVVIQRFNCVFANQTKPTSQNNCFTSEKI
jgi:hypothetical protein